VQYPAVGQPIRMFTIAFLGNRAAPRSARRL